VKALRLLLGELLEQRDRRLGLVGELALTAGVF